MNDTFIPPPVRKSFVPRLKWRQNRRGAWITNILDTAKPESLGIFPAGESFNLVVWRSGGNHLFGDGCSLGRFDDVDAAKEFARQLVGDKEIY